MKLLTSVLMGGDREDLSQDALRSAAQFTDRFLLIRTDHTADTAIAQALEEYPHAIVEQIDWDGRCSTGRNEQARLARKYGADWLLTLDTDERLVVPAGYDLRERLAKTTVDVILVRDATGDYRKTKFFRMPARGEYKEEPTADCSPGTHEYYQPGPGEVVAVLGGCYFLEIPKSPEVQSVRMAGIEAACRKQIACNPSSARSWYYLGDALANQMKCDEALFAFVNCHSVSDWPDEKWWCLYRAAWVRMSQGMMASAVEYCRLGGIAQPTWPEFPWLAAVGCAKCSAWEQAIEFALEAEALGFEQRIREHSRNFFVNRTAWWEGPADVLRRCYANIGEVEKAKAAHARFLELEIERSKH